jgi:hypothetical protein
MSMEKGSLQRGGTSHVASAILDRVGRSCDVAAMVDGGGRIRSDAPLVPAPEPAPEKVAAVRRGFKILGGVIVFFLVGGITLGVVLMQNPRVRNMVRTLREGVGAAVAGQHAPGTDELRAAGCTTAMVLDVRRTMKRIAPTADVESGPAAGLGDALVICAVTGETILTCEHVAEIYGRAVSSEAPFAVTLQGRGSKEPNCSGLFSRDGTRLRDIPTGKRG